MSTTLQIVIAILTGGIGVGIVEGIREGLRWRRERKAKKEDREAVNLDSWREETDKKMNALRSTSCMTGSGFWDRHTSPKAR